MELEKYLLAGAEELKLELPEAAVAAFRQYYNFLQEENQKYNLTAITSEKEAASKHFLDSLVLKKYLPREKQKMIDLGSGAGFPGLPLAICCPQLQMVLADSVGKKTGFLQQVIELLKLKSRVEVVQARAEDLGRNSLYRENFDLVVARALAPLSVLLEYALPLLKVGGIFWALKGAAAQEENEGAVKAYQKLGGILEGYLEFALPEGKESRCLLKIRKVEPTPKKYPRKPGIPAKRPL
ncbi:MAG: 16S rRNA (guanine(527)-N(7))-methyltransferase RsmG [Clostridia bacterium]|nr:16S rRNA (guanine(527)-N(7))-methyltransferase RsmG [Clostridia bacterium]